MNKDVRQEQTLLFCQFEVYVLEGKAGSTTLTDLNVKQDLNWVMGHTFKSAVECTITAMILVMNIMY